jgi:glycine/D-amino acid oxidase-like deaminating enzyme
MTNTASPGDSWASLNAQYEYIVVGAGAAGSVLGAELSEAGAMGEQHPRMVSLRRCHGT